jgi:hypothetical protein
MTGMGFCLSWLLFFRQASEIPSWGSREEEKREEKMRYLLTKLYGSYTTISGGSNMQKRNRFIRSGKKYPKRQVITTSNAEKSKVFYAKTDADAPLEPHVYAAGVIQHPITQLYQVWLSTNGLDVICLSAHHSQEQAEKDKQEVKVLISNGDLYNDEKLTALFQRLKQESDEEPKPLPDEIVRQITREILRAVVDRPSQP